MPVTGLSRGRHVRARLCPSGKSATPSDRLPGSGRDPPARRNEDLQQLDAHVLLELPLDKVALGDLIATENPLVLENLPRQ